MSAWYNENDPFAAAWLRELIANNLIAPGDVDERSIEDVKPDDLRPYAQCHFFAGIGIWSLALRRSGVPDDMPVWTGSCPCQPFSAAGEGKGFVDERHLWPAFHWLIEQRRPGLVLGEQVASKDGLTWLDLVQADMEAADYAFGAVDLCAAGFQGNHGRQRLFWVADAHGRQSRHSWPLQRCRQHRKQSESIGSLPRAILVECNDGRMRPLQSGIFPLADAHSGRLGLVRCYGNALDVEVAQGFIEAVMDHLKIEEMMNG